MEPPRGKREGEIWRLEEELAQAQLRLCRHASLSHRPVTRVTGSDLQTIQFV